MPDYALVPDEEVVFAMMNAILDSIRDTYRSSNVDLPERQYTLIGSSAHDCEQLTVSFIQMYLGPPGAQSETPQKCAAPRTCVFVVQLVRQVALPGSGRQRTVAPTPEHMDLHTAEKLRDVWLLQDAVLNPASGVDDVIADITVTDQQGEFQAVVLNLSVQVP